MPLESTVAEPPETEGTTRRGFYTSAVYAIWGLIAASLGGPALGYLFLPPKARRDESWIDVADVTGLTPNEPVEIVFHRNRVDGWKVVSEKNTAWLVKSNNNEVSAFGPQCTHLGCAYHWDGARDEFVCPCHNSVFAITGQVVSGPAPRPLDRYKTKIQGATLLVGRLQTPTERNA
jgi:menaquinol-cytochrome c reductase iron-sulfur subunit